MSIYINNNPKFCTYLTIYSGDLLPPFYIGSSSIEKVLSGYHGSVKSKKYKTTWKQEIKDNPQLFKTIILEKFHSRKNAVHNEKLLQIQFNVVKSNQFINMSLASHKGYSGMDVSGKITRISVKNLMCRMKQSKNFLKV